MILQSNTVSYNLQAHDTKCFVLQTTENKCQKAVRAAQAIIYKRQGTITSRRAELVHTAQ
jgi:phosphohistidine swiveling domain-containing protein